MRSASRALASMEELNLRLPVCGECHSFSTIRVWASHNGPLMSNGLLWPEPRIGEECHGTSMQITSYRAECNHGPQRRPDRCRDYSERPWFWLATTRGGRTCVPERRSACGRRPSPGLESTRRHSHRRQFRWIPSVPSVCDQVGRSMVPFSQPPRRTTRSSAALLDSCFGTGGWHVG